MATNLFHVKVLSKEETAVVLGLRIITGEQPDFYDSESFALALLYDPIADDEVTDAPLGREFSLEESLDPAWMADNVDEYIAGARLYDIKNSPLPEDLGKLSFDERHEFFESDRAPTAKFEIRVTSPEWVEHIRPGMEWKTASYDVLE